MKNALYFVTAVCLLFTVAACKNHDRKNEDIKDGNAKIDQALVVEADLRAHNIVLDNEASKAMARDLNWRQFSLEERNKVKEDLSRFIALSSDVLALDARHGITITHKDQVIGKRDNAMEFEKSVENFEKIFGESYRPKTDTSQPIFNRSLDI